jgi:hypothetical protein
MAAYDPDTDPDAIRYMAALHAIQSGVAALMAYGIEQTEPKHLRVGINSAFINCAGLARLLISKGVFTEAEYSAAMADEAEAEQHRYEQEIGRHLGTEVHLH